MFSSHPQLPCEAAVEVVQALVQRPVLAYKIRRELIPTMLALSIGAATDSPSGGSVGSLLSGRTKRLLEFVVSEPFAWDGKLGL